MKVRKELEQMTPQEYLDEMQRRRMAKEAASRLRGYEPAKDHISF